MVIELYTMGLCVLPPPSNCCLALLVVSHVQVLALWSSRWLGFDCFLLGLVWCARVLIGNNIADLLSKLFSHVITSGSFWDHLACWVTSLTHCVFVRGVCAGVNLVPMLSRYDFILLSLHRFIIYQFAIILIYSYSYYWYHLYVFSSTLLTTVLLLGRLLDLKSPLRPINRCHCHCTASCGWTCGLHFYDSCVSELSNEGLLVSRRVPSLVPGTYHTRVSCARVGRPVFAGKNGSVSVNIELPARFDILWKQLSIWLVTTVGF